MIIDMTLTLWMVTSCIIVARTDRATINGKKKRCEQRGPTSTSSWPIGSDETRETHLISRVLAQLDWGVGLCHWLHKLCSYNGVLACRYWNWWQPIQRAVSCEANKLKMCKLVSSFMGSLEFEVVIYPLVCIPFISATELPYSMPQAVHASLIRCKIRDEWE